MSRGMSFLQSVIGFGFIVYDDTLFKNTFL